MFLGSVPQYSALLYASIPLVDRIQHYPLWTYLMRTYISLNAIFFILIAPLLHALPHTLPTLLSPCYTASKPLTSVLHTFTLSHTTSIPWSTEISSPSFSVWGTGRPSLRIVTPVITTKMVKTVMEIVVFLIVALRAVLGSVEVAVVAVIAVLGRTHSFHLN